MMKEPFYGILLSSIVKEPSLHHEIDTFGVTTSGDTFKLMYNPEFVSRLSDNAILEILKHEMLHLALNHLWISKDENYKDNDIHIANVAADLEVNQYLDYDLLQRECGCVTIQDFDFEPKLGLREYFKLLKQKENNDTQQWPGSSCGDNNDRNSSSNSNNNTHNYNDNKINTNKNKNKKEQEQTKVQIGNNTYKTTDDHTKWKQDNSVPVEVLKNKLEQILITAAEETEKSYGIIPSEMKIKIEQLRKKPKPVTDWRKYCRRYLSNKYQYLTKKSRKSESKRFPDAMGTRHQKMANALIAIDTSGSICMNDYKEFMGQIFTIKDKIDFTIIECDSEIKRIYNFNGKINTELTGGGGTDFRPVINYFIKNHRQFDCLIYFTDGYCDIPKNTPQNTLWVISSNGLQNDPNRYRVNNCSSIFIKHNDN